MTTTDVPSYRIKVTLTDVRPRVWRRLVLPGQWHLGQVHAALQVAMGWTDSHLHEFEAADGSKYSAPDPDGDLDYTRPETKVRLHEVAPAKGARLRYLYDFGDCWQHDILVESLGEPASQASCLAGERACPPEDCGGPWNYPDALAAATDPADPEHERYAEWLGDFDPEAFDLADTDRRLRALTR